MPLRTSSNRATAVWQGISRVGHGRGLSARTRRSDKAGDDRKENRGSAVTAAAPARQHPDLSSPQGLLALQNATGNAAVVQLLRRAGHSWAQEEHRHSADCGHRGAAEPTVRRSAVHDVLRAPGQPLDDATRTDMEARLGADFSDVRIHDDSAARASAAEVGARAYTSGSHVVIGDGGADKHTLAHELTHVIQQRQGPVAGTDNGGGPRVSDPSDRFEQAAEANARRVMSGPARPCSRRLAELEEKGHGRLKLYRTMFASEAIQIMEWKGKATATEEWPKTESKDGDGIAKRFREAVADGSGDVGVMPVSNHLGDAGRADAYFHDEEKQVMVEFTLKEGAHELLFHPQYMAISGDKGTPYHIRKTREEETGSTFPTAAGGEGKLPGFIGLKPEAKEPFSLSLGDSDITRLLFRLFVEDVKAVKGEKNV